MTSEEISNYIKAERKLKQDKRKLIAALHSKISHMTKIFGLSYCSSPHREFRVTQTQIVFSSTLGVFPYNQPFHKRSQEMINFMSDELTKFPIAFLSKSNEEISKILKEKYKNLAQEIEIRNNEILLTKKREEELKNIRQKKLRDKKAALAALTEEQRKALGFKV